ERYSMADLLRESADAKARPGLSAMISLSRLWGALKTSSSSGSPISLWWNALRTMRAWAPSATRTQIRSGFMFHLPDIARSVDGLARRSLDPDQEAAPASSC